MIDRSDRFPLCCTGYYPPPTGVILARRRVRPILAAPRRLPCGCWTPTTTAAASTRGKFSLCLPRGSDQFKWLAKTLKAEVDEELIESYYGTQSLPFEPDDFKRVAVKIIDDRGIESLKLVNLE